MFLIQLSHHNVNTFKDMRPIFALFIIFFIRDENANDLPVVQNS